MRAQLEKRLAQKEKERKEENLRELAKKAREERAGIRPAPSKEGETQRRQGTRAVVGTEPVRWGSGVG